MKLLITRPRADALALAKRLEAGGHQVLIEPIFDIVRIEGALPPLDGVTALIFTSTNGVRSFAEASSVRNLPVYAVGQTTAAALAEAGFTTIHKASGDGRALAALIETDRKPGEGRLLHIAGTEVASDLVALLGAQGFEVERAALYEARAAEALSPATRLALEQGGLDGVLLFSPRTARVFAELVIAAGLKAHAAILTAWVISEAVATAAAGLPFQAVRVSAAPTEAALVTLIEASQRGHAAGATESIRPSMTASMNEPAHLAATPEKPPANAPVNPSAADATGDRPQMQSDRRPRRKRLTAIALAALVVLLIAGTAVTTPDWAPLVMARLPWSPRTSAMPAADSGTVATTTPAPSPPAAPSAPADAPPSAASSAGSSTPAAAPPDDATAQRLAALEAEIADLRQKIGRTAAAVSGAAKPEDHAALDALSSDERKLAVTVGSLGARLGRLEETVAAAGAQARNNPAMALAAVELEAALWHAEPYEAPLAVLRALAADDPGLAGELSAPMATLAAHAHDGLPSRIVLAQRLRALEPTLTTPPQSGDGSWWHHALDRAEHLVSIRRVAEDEHPEAGPPGPERSLAMAEAAVDRDDLAGAVHDLDDLPSPAAGAAAGWIDAAKARLEGEQAAARIRTALTARLAAPNPGPSPAPGAAAISDDAKSDAGAEDRGNAPASGGETRH